ncbi:M20/M25/M40 family metallo-hydrolase [Lacticigenium naphthae]|uniref:M20/M25/M40 family metallo-hydrolase n=1 Tax=Lacticigenium naphthae TaxID=515351 RepID=UPI0003FD6FB1|nr:M20/M25/M40 family metallo-hydrolase [Lacticigenium naphthae]
MYKSNTNKKWYPVLIASVMGLSLFTPTSQEVVLAESAENAVVINSSEYGGLAYEHINHLSKGLGGARVAGSEFEKEAANYIKGEFESNKYETALENFSFISKRGSNKGETVNSQNVVAIKRGKSGKQVILGAHYDQVTSGGSEGASDNASGVGAMLEVAEKLKNVKTDHTIIFVGFGSEEVGLEGSNAYVETMSEDEIENTIAMINLDTILAGDYAYVYGGSNGQGWVRDQALNISEELGLDLITQTGLHPDHKWGETGDWSDHAPFNEKNIPVAYFESTNWLIQDEAGNYLDGYIETEEGPIMHSGNDTLEYIELNYPGRIMERLNTNVRVLEKLMIEIATDEYKAAAVEVEQLISKFKSSETNISNGYISKVRKAREAYDALTDAQKEFVTTSNVEKLNTAEENIKNEEDKEAAVEVDKLVIRFKSSEKNISKQYISKVKEAREAFDALTDEQKELVAASNVQKLNAAEEMINE